jgi:hypothetical protein
MYLLRTGFGSGGVVVTYELPHLRQRVVAKVLAGEREALGRPKVGRTMRFPPGTALGVMSGLRYTLELDRTYGALQEVVVSEEV